MADENLTSMEQVDLDGEFSKEAFRDEGDANWEALEKDLEEKTHLTVKVENTVNKGVVTTVEGIRGFIPASHLALTHVDDLNTFVGKEIEVQVIDLDKQKNRLVLSAREVLREQAKAARAEKIASIEVGSLMDGKVESIKDYGAFIDLGDGISGLLHVSQIANKRIKTPEDVLSVGQDVKVKVIAVKDGKLSLSMKNLDGKAPERENRAPREDRGEKKEHIKLPQTGDLTTNLGSLLSGIKLDQ
ncbi:MAG: S1 RNA-binding domain-containing protein [Eubacterium sp.]|nr:S1 RNA-binding domain-containing protein [Eubacterium sp.]